MDMLGGPFLFLLTLFLPLPIEPQAKTLLAVFLWVMCNWLLTSVPLFVTGLFGVTLAVMLGVGEPKEAFAPLADPLIFLFMGGFFMARAFEASGLDRKISLLILNHPLVKGHLHRTICAILLISGFISMWVSNTATMAMMLPVVMGIIKSIDLQDRKAKGILIVATAYACTIGGGATPMGSPPNFIVFGMLQELAGIKLNFFTWVAIALPISVVLLLFICWYTVRLFPDTNVKIQEIEGSVRLDRRDYLILAIFGTAIFLWFAPSFVSLFLGEKHPVSVLLDTRLSPGIVSIFFASLLFVLPLNSKEKILSLKEGMKIDWGTLLLFGTGLSLGQMLFKVGIAQIAGTWVMQISQSFPYIFFLMGIVAFTIFFSEFVSNTACANILLPLIIATSLKGGTTPVLDAIAVGLGCNLAFMLPVGTPPNAIAYGTGLITFKEMVRFGLVLNLLSIVLITIAVRCASFFF